MSKQKIIYFTSLSFVYKGKKNVLKKNREAISARRTK